MADRKQYYTRATEFISEELYHKIRRGVDTYFLSEEGLSTEKLSMTMPATFKKLIGRIERENPTIDITPKFLIDLYGNRKTNRSADKAILTAICKTIKVEDEGVPYVIKDILLGFKSLCHDDPRLPDFAGQYKLFLGGRRKPSIYDEVYENELIVFGSGMAKLFNPFSKKLYWGYCLIREGKTLEIISFDFSDRKINGIGSVLMFKVNEYKKQSYLLPGINFGFDSSNQPIIYQALLCTDFATKKSDPLIASYFTTAIDQLRMECPDLSDTEKLREYFS